jgi:hypothetical protein
VIAGFDLRTNLTFIEIIATAGKLFFAISWLSHGNWFAPVRLGTEGTLSIGPLRYCTRIRLFDRV